MRSYRRLEPYAVAIAVAPRDPSPERPSPARPLAPRAQRLRSAPLSKSSIARRRRQIRPAPSSRARTAAARVASSSLEQRAALSRRRHHHPLPRPARRRLNPLSRRFAQRRFAVVAVVVAPNPCRARPVAMTASHAARRVAIKPPPLPVPL